MLRIKSKPQNKIKQITPAILLGLVIVLLTILFASETFLSALGLNQFRSEYRSLLGFTLLVSISFTFVNILFAVSERLIIRQKIELRKSHQKQLTPQYNDVSLILSTEEKVFLDQYVFNNKGIKY